MEYVVVGLNSIIGRNGFKLARTLGYVFDIAYLKPFWQMGVEP